MCSFSLELNLLYQAPRQETEYLEVPPYALIADGHKLLYQNLYLPATKPNAHLVPHICLLGRDLRFELFQITTLSFHSFAQYGDESAAPAWREY